ncbi:MAG: dihydrofolate reductase family protein [Bacteroidota bacterium]
MAEIKVYIASSIDGYIARKDGALDWLDALPNPNQIDHGYADFYATIDTVIMGKSTYEEILGFDVAWPYANCLTYVLTSDDNYTLKTENTSRLASVSKSTINKIVVESKKNIWIVGGGQTIAEFLKYDSIDEMIICQIPTILGNGIRLFPEGVKETVFEMVRTEPFETGAVSVTYRRKQV